MVGESVGAGLIVGALVVGLVVGARVPQVPSGLKVMQTFAIPGKEAISIEVAVILRALPLPPKLLME